MSETTAYLLGGPMDGRTVPPLPGSWRIDLPTPAVWAEENPPVTFVTYIRQKVAMFGRWGDVWVWDKLPPAERDALCADRFLTPLARQLMDRPVPGRGPGAP